jgi:hypothetical protein
MALPLDGAGSTEGLSFATEMGPVKRNAIAPNASRRLASNAQAPLGHNAATPLRTLLATLSLFIACLLVSISLRNENSNIDVLLSTRDSVANIHRAAS